MTFRPVLLALAVLFLLDRHDAFAQGNSTNSIKSCSEATRFVQNGRPAHKQTAAIDYLARCGNAGATVVAGTVASVHDERDLNTLNEFFTLLYAWRDATVMQATITLAQDGSATVPARVFAITNLLRLVNPGYQYSYAKLTEEGVHAPHIPCVHGYASVGTSGAAFGQPLPADYESRIGAVLTSLSNDTSQPLAVRNAASCIAF